MSHSATEVIVGGLVLAGAVAFGAYAVSATAFSAGGNKGYPLSASFRSLEGITVGSDVRLAGVKVGSVSEIRLNPETYRADMTLKVQEGVQLPDDSSIVISSEGLLGGNFVEISPGGSPFYYGPGDEVLDTQGSVSLISLLLKYVAGGSE
ncbi:outer membrane lipid asymmetry maintenance protein MlaD [Salipiger mangrovisoli]|uniref:Outer membrane lipid asymmetry maintenance protein MlaD n=1 Tax=Salipiger mangrovisoli TaxID=2865933 RepID=A0ABR9X7C4_9RHOB|nr:outer membrane lipid asymmetry maintenance protein MlaD [Salipiger mangrovisoli]MBE9639410.1 outer membrane lipid asymmetry maintenance protein MlaD [Salipiger mangrovisoli]